MPKRHVQRSFGLCSLIKTSDPAISKKPSFGMAFLYVTLNLKWDSTRGLDTHRSYIEEPTPHHEARQMREVKSNRDIRTMR